MILGIDPGAKGAFAILDENGIITRYETLPTTLDGKKTVVDSRRLHSILSGYRFRLAVLEKVGARPDQGVTSMFTFGRSLGRIEAVLDILRCAVEFPTPQRWKKVVLEGTDRSKDATISWCRRRHPEVELILPRCRKPHDGVADAVALCEFGRIVLGLPS